MSIRCFVFCDLCNQQCVRCPEQRRGGGRDPRAGRRVTDGRAWFEGGLETACAEFGWVVARDGRHLCPDCHGSHPDIAIREDCKSP